MAHRLISSAQTECIRFALYCTAVILRAFFLLKEAGIWKGFTFPPVSLFRPKGQDFGNEFAFKPSAQFFIHTQARVAVLVTKMTEG